MPSLDFPVNPLRDTLYTRDSLYGNYSLEDPLSVKDTLDFKLFKGFVMDGGPMPQTYNAGIMRSLHDNSITEQLERLRRRTPRIAAIMGGHRERRGSAIYRNVCLMSAHLTRSGLLMASGGGPGAMEACHLGAYLSQRSDDEIMQAVDTLSDVADLPQNLRDLVKPDGTVNDAIIHEIHSWLKPAFQLIQQYPDGRNSLAIPTWLYGHEPACPFANSIAKYFQNSIREDGLLAIAKYGIIFTKGQAGTLQEVFQDAAQNYYNAYDWFSPMIFLDDEDCWSVTFPVIPILRTMFCRDEAHCDVPTYTNYVKVTKDWREAVRILKEFVPPYTPQPKESGENLRDL
ncbi:MAG: hypothetical protein ACAI35_20425 [Candidatus Methylacidiphilales bacterium]|nr:hypothetical protein [Candidatus Methylacidiphilales bacterium]